MLPVTARPGFEKGAQMRVPHVNRLSAIAGAVVLVAACSGGGSSSPGVSVAPPSSTAPSGSAGGGGGGSAGSLDACNLLTAADIAGVVGWPVKDGLPQNTDTQSDCEWDAQATDGGSVGLTIQAYDDSLWQAGSSAGNSTAVTGIGDAAYKGWPHPGDLAIKVKGYEVDVAIIDFAASPDKVDAETLALAKIVLPKL